MEVQAGNCAHSAAVEYGEGKAICRRRKNSRRPPNDPRGQNSLMKTTQERSYTRTENVGPIQFAVSAVRVGNG
ncbi:hypothetical protein BJ956_001468 [Arthrobacter psychrochitiniphilus]|nr:hypothetical protein [Arthrobacter psychrochitiniphilus]